VWAGYFPAGSIHIHFKSGFTRSMLVEVFLWILQDLRNASIMHRLSRK
jgi:hypothetical protein